MRNLFFVCALAFVMFRGCEIQPQPTPEPTDNLQQAVEDYRRNLFLLTADVHAEHAELLSSEQGEEITAADDNSLIFEATKTARNAARKPLDEIVNETIGGKNYSREKSAELNRRLAEAFRKAAK